ncbi:hypothetical protein IJ103_02980 [Candidatus Saccharibacteria bacterium]|nr:hypothetical protein [Candidatus Saccharibacteria bacterium]
MNKKKIIVTSAVLAAAAGGTYVALNRPVSATDGETTSSTTEKPKTSSEQ